MFSGSYKVRQDDVASMRDLSPCLLNSQARMPSFLFFFPSYSFYLEMLLMTLLRNHLLMILLGNLEVLE